MSTVLKHIMVKFKDGEEKKIELRDSDFAYNLDDSKEVESMKLYRGDKLLKPDGFLFFYFFVTYVLSPNIIYKL